MKRLLLKMLLLEPEPSAAMTETSLRIILLRPPSGHRRIECAFFHDPHDCIKIVVLSSRQQASIGWLGFFVGIPAPASLGHPARFSNGVTSQERRASSKPFYPRLLGILARQPNSESWISSQFLGKDLYVISQVWTLEAPVIAWSCLAGDAISQSSFQGLWFGCSFLFLPKVNSHSRLALS